MGCRLRTQYGSVDAVLFEYADGFRGGLRAYEAAKKALRSDRVAAYRRAGVILRLGKGQRSELQDLFYSNENGQNDQARFALTAAMMKKEGKDVPATINGAVQDARGRQGSVQSGNP